MLEGHPDPNAVHIGYRRVLNDQGRDLRTRAQNCKHLRATSEHNFFGHLIRFARQFNVSQAAELFPPTDPLPQYKRPNTITLDLEIAGFSHAISARLSS